MNDTEIRIVYIEDNEADFVLFKKHILRLENGQYHLDHVVNYAELDEKLASGSYDIYFIDYNLAGEHTGLEIVEILKTRDIDGPFVLLTGIDQHDLQIRSSESGIYDYILKGEINTSLLERVVRHSIARHREHKRLIELERVQQQRQKMESLGLLASGVAHELNNLIQPVMLASDRIQGESGGNEKIDNAVDIIDRNISAAADIIGNVLGFSRMDDGRKTDVIMVDAIEKSLDFIAGLLPKDIEVVRTHFDQAQDYQCHISESGLTHVLTNLLLNASQAMDSKGKIEVKVEADDTTHEYTIKVSDQGEGIPDDIVHKIFDPFFTTKQAGKGTGLGLSIAYSIVKGWDGTIGVERSDKTGTVFAVRIPTLENTAHAAA